MKAGKLASGDFAVEKAIKGRKAKLVIIANDCAENTKKKIRNSCEYYNINMVEFGEKSMLGKFCGKEFRASIAIMDKSFSARIVNMISEMNTQTGVQTIG